jgi:type II secretory pathway pseudopilin PulG
MPLAKGSQHFPTTQREWDQWSRDVPVTPDDGSVTPQTIAPKAVTDEKLRDSAPASVIGRVAATAGQPGDIVSTPDRFLVNRAGVLGFGTIGDTDIPASIARDTEITAAITALKAETDPFPQYETQAEGDARYVQLANVIDASATYDPPSLADGAGVTTTLAITGAAMGDFVLVSFSNDLQGITLTGWISVAGTASARFQNESGGTLDLTSGTLRFRVWKQ